VLTSHLTHPRVGIVVPRHRHTAVDRNRLKRRLRELVRLELLPVMRSRHAVDLVIRAQRDAYNVDMEALRTDIATVSHRLAAGDGAV